LNGHGKFYTTFMTILKSEVLYKVAKKKEVKEMIFTQGGGIGRWRGNFVSNGLDHLGNTVKKRVALRILKISEEGLSETKGPLFKRWSGWGVGRRGGNMN